MGKVFSTIQKLKSKDKAARRAQQKVFKSLADDENFQWQDPQHKGTMYEASYAAQRLSIYKHSPEDSEERKQYIKDQQTVEEAIETIKQNKSGNLSNIKLAMKKAISLTPKTSHSTPQWANDSQPTTKSSLQCVKPSLSSSKHSSPQYDEAFAITYDDDDEHKASEIWDSDSDNTEHKNIIKKCKSISSSYPYDENPPRPTPYKHQHYPDQQTHNAEEFDWDPQKEIEKNIQNKRQSISSSIITSSDVDDQKQSQQQQKHSEEQQQRVVITVTEECQWDDDGADEEEEQKKEIMNGNDAYDDDDDGYTQEHSSSSYVSDAQDDIKYEEIITDKNFGISEVTISVPSYAWKQDNDNKSNNNSNVTSPTDNLAAPTSYSAYSGMRIQVDVLCSFHDSPWILNKDKKGDSNHLKIKHSDRIKNVREYHSNRRVSLTNGHNFLWFTNTIQSSTYAAEQESEITRKSLDKVLNLLPIPFRDKIWEICNPDNDTFMFQEDFAEFADAMLIATGQYDIDDDIDEIDFEIRDMTSVFNKIVNSDKIFRDKRYYSKWSKSTRCLSTEGATIVVMKARNMKIKALLSANDGISIALLTGFTKVALKHAIAWCTRVFWKLLTDCWWDEDDEEDMALPVSLSKYDNESQRNLKQRSRSRRGTKINPDQREAMKQAMSMEVLFPDLIFDESDAEDFDQTFTQYLKIID